MKYNKKQKRNHLKEFSKIVIVMFAIMWMIAGLFLLWVVWFQVTNAGSPEYVTADVVCTYFMAPITAGLISYFAKAAFENGKKIKGSIEKELISMEDQQESYDVPYDIDNSNEYENINNYDTEVIQEV